MELISTLDYKGYTIRTFKMSGKDGIKISFGDEQIEYNPETDQPYEGSLHEKKGIDAAKQFIDELEEKENSL